MNAPFSGFILKVFLFICVRKKILEKQRRRDKEKTEGLKLSWKKLSVKMCERINAPLPFTTFVTVHAREGIKIRKTIFFMHIRR